jgi:hypothetical protein
MNRTFVEKSEKSLIKFNTKKDGLARIFHIFEGGREIITLIHHRYLFKFYPQNINLGQLVEATEWTPHMCFRKGES